MRKAIAAVIVAGIALAAAGSARADRLLLAPTGRQLGAFEAKYEAVFHGGEGSYQWLQVGIPRVELQVMRENPLHGGTATGFGAQMEILPATSFAPAISAGVRDVNDCTQQGRAGYLATSLPLPLSLGPARSVTLNAGLGCGDIKGAFGGADVALQNGWRLMVEHDSRRLNAGLDVPVAPHLNLRAESLAGKPYFGLTLNIGKGDLGSAVTGLMSDL